MKKINELKRKDLMALIEANQILLDMGIYNEQLDSIFEDIRKSDKKDLFFNLLDDMGR